MKHFYDKELLQKAKSMYMEDVAVTEISKELDIKLDALRYYVKTKWKQEREAKKHEIIEALTESKKAAMFSIAKNGLNILDKAFSTMAKDPDLRLTATEVHKISSVIKDMDNIIKLDEGSPTDRDWETLLLF